MATAKFMDRLKRKRLGPLGFSAKVLIAVVLGLVFTVVWSLRSSPSSVVSERRTSFGDVPELTEINSKETPASLNRTAPAVRSRPATLRSPNSTANQTSPEAQKEEETDPELDENKDNEREVPDEEAVEKEDNSETEEQENEEEAIADEESVEDGEDSDGNEKTVKDSESGPLFDPKARYSWKSCDVKKGPHYVPCIDLEVAGSGSFQGHRHHERSCPNPLPLCLIPLPAEYKPSVAWPESRSKIFFPNVAHPMLSAYIKSHKWLRLDGKFLNFPRNETILPDGGSGYLDFVEETVPQIEFGKNIRVVLDIQSTDSGFVAALLKKNVLTISLGLMRDQTDLAQLSLERGFPAIIGSLGNRRLPFPSAVFDAVHCADCGISWHSRGGKPILEMNRILRPGGYFILSSFKQGNIESEEGISASIASISWETLAHRNDEDNVMEIKIYQKPSSNDVYQLRGIKNPPLCEDNKRQDDAWYTRISPCIHAIPESIDDRGTEWPEEWPKRLDNFPEWLSETQERIMADTERWRSTLNRSYLSGLGIDWSRVRNVMDMKANYGGFAAALELLNVWVMNVVPVRGPKTLPIIFERGLVGVYHDWCEPFSSYPRSYDLLHADHLFSRRKNRCKQPVGIVVEMDRLLRPGGWAIIREKQEILLPLQEILRTLRWEFRMTYSKDGEGLLCAQKMIWRP